MSRDWTSRVLTVAIVVLMVTSTLAPVAAAGSPSTPTAPAGSNSNSFDFSGIDSDNAAGDDGTPTADVGTPNVQPATALPFYAEPELQRVEVDLGEPTSNGDGTVKIPVHVKGEYKEGQYPWRIPVSVRIESGELSESAVVNLAPSGTSDDPQDYRASTQFTLQFVQDGTTNHAITATAISQVGERDAEGNLVRESYLRDTDAESVSVDGVSDESDVTTSGDIRNDDVSEPPNEVSHVTRYRASDRASGYLEDSSLPVGTESKVENFTYTRDANNKHAVFQSFRGDMLVGTLTSNVPNGSSQTVVIRYRSLTNEDVRVTPVDSSGSEMDGGTDYVLPADPSDSDRCHEGDDADICIFRLSSNEVAEIGQQNELILAYYARESAALAVFCQDTVTGGMPDSGEVCGLGEVSSYSEGRIVGMRAVDTGSGNSATQESTLSVNQGADVRIDVILENKGNTPTSGTVQLTTTDPTNYSAQTEDVTLSGGEREVVSFSGYSMDKIVTFDAAFKKSDTWVEVSPTGLSDSANPVSVPGGPYIVPLEQTGAERTKLGLQQQTLSERPGPDWTKITTEGSSGGTDEWTTYVYRVPVIGTIGGLEAASDNISYMNRELSVHEGTVTVQDAYGEHLNNAKRQLPANTDASDWTLHDIQFTTNVETETKIDTERPDGYGWRKVDKYGSVATGEYEQAQFRSLANGSEVSQGGTIIDTDGAGWVKQDDIPPEERLTGYVYNNTSEDPDFYEEDDMTDGEDDWEKYQFVETRYVLEDRINWSHRYQEEKYDPGGNWTFVDQMDNGSYHYSKRTYEEVDIWTWRRPVYHWYHTYERPVTATSYEWERQVYDAKFIFQKSASSGTESLWQGPLYKWESQYESQEVMLNGERSYDLGPEEDRGIAAYQWEFDDGTKSERGSSAMTTSREYSTPFGVYYPSLTVWDNMGNSATNQTEVHVIPEPLDCESPCDPYAAIPELSATEKRDPVDYQMQTVDFKVDISGKLYDREWTVNITAPEANGSFEQEIWRSYDIVDGEEEIHGQINPRVNELGPGAVEFVVTATPADSSEPRVVDTFEVYLCHQDLNGFSPSEEGCNDLDPDNDNTPNQYDTDPYCNESNNAEEESSCFCARNPEDDRCTVEDWTPTETGYVEQSAVWNTPYEWESSESRRHLTLVGSGVGNPDYREGTLRIGHERNVTMQENLYMSSSSTGLIAYYDMEKDDLYFSDNPSDWWLADDSPGHDHRVPIFADKNAKSNGGDFQNGNNAGGQYADRAPRFGGSGVFGSTGVHWDTETFGFIEFVSPYDCVGCAGWLTGGDEDDRAGDAMSDEFYNDATISFWARDTSVRESKNEYNEAIWTMQAEHNHGFDSAVQNLHLSHTCDSMSGEFAATTQCATPAMSHTDLHYLQRWHSDKSGASESLASKHDLNNENVAGMDSFSDGQWHHYTYVVDGGTGYGDSVKLYIDGDLEYSRTFSETYGSNADFAYFTINNAPSSHAMTRFIWGGSWSDTSGLVRPMHGMRYDDIRIHNEALTQYEVSEYEHVDNHGYLRTGPKWLNYSQDSYNTSNGMNVTFDGYIPVGNSVDVQVIPWDDNGPNYAASDTVTFTGYERREEVTLDTEKVGRVSIRVDAYSDSPSESPYIESVGVLALEEVEFDIDNTDPVPVMFSNASETDDATGTKHVDSGDVINFVGDRSTDETGNISQYQYKVDGPAGASANEQSGEVNDGSEIPDYQHEFKCGGEHTVTLTVQDDFGAVNSTSIDFEVENDKPIADPTPKDTTVNPGETVNFDGTGSHDPDGEIINYDWHFEHVDQHNYNPSASWTYEEPGEYFVNFTVTDDGCEQDTERIRVMVTNDPPTADAGDDQTVQPNEEVTFDGSGSDEPNGDTMTYDWDIDGDGNYELTDAGPEPTYTYSSEGTRTVTLRVSDPYGGSDTDTMTVDVQDPWSSRTWIDADFDDGWDGFSSYRGAGRGTHTSDSPSYSAYVKGYSGSRIVSPSVDLSDARGVTLDYWMRRGDNSFSEQPDSGENMRLQYRTSSGGWSTLKTYYGSGTNGQVYRESINLPSGAYHDNFAIRYRLTDTSGTNFDYYHMDEVRLTGEEFTGPVGSMNSIGETGSMTVTADDGNWQTLNFQNSYNNPVVIMKPISSDGGHPSHIRLQNVNGNSAQVQVEEWDYLDGPHATVTAHYVVMEQGEWTLDDGTKVVAGTTDTDDHGTSVSFPSSFSGTPVVFTQDQTRNGGDPAVTRNWNVGSNGFSTRVQEEEANGGHTTETIGYIAIAQGTGSTGGINFEAYREGNSFTDSWRQINFARSYGSDRNVVLDMQTEDGGDTAGLRFKDFNSGNVDTFVEEEESDDSETSHTTESVGYWVFDSDGTIVGGGGDGGSSGSTAPPKYKITSNSYTWSYDGNQACREEFGSSYGISSWSEVESDFNRDAMTMRSYFDDTPTEGGRTVGRVTYNGAQDTGSYAWWVGHEPDRYVDNSGAYVADGTGSGRDHYLWVGRWDGNYRVMCENPNGEF